jgi:hypothetical protein
VLPAPQTSSTAITSGEDEVLDRSIEALVLIGAVTCVAATEHTIVQHQLVQANHTCLDPIEGLMSRLPRRQLLHENARAHTSHEVLAALAHGTRTTREEWADAQRVIIETAPHDKAAAAVHAPRIERYRTALGAVAEWLATLDGPTFDRERVAAILWFYFGPSAYQSLHDDQGWSYAETEPWLLAQCEHALDLS